MKKRKRNNLTAKKIGCSIKKRLKIINLLMEVYMKRILFLICTLFLSCTFCFAETSEEELYLETAVGTNIWNIVESEDGIMPVGSFQLLDEDENLIKIELTTRGYVGFFKYITVEQKTDNTYKVEAVSKNQNITRRVTLVFNLLNYPDDIIVKEYHDSDLVQTLYLNTDAVGDSDYDFEYEPREREIYDYYNDFGL